MIFKAKYIPQIRQLSLKTKQAWSNKSFVFNAAQLGVGRVQVLMSKIPEKVFCQPKSLDEQNLQVGRVSIRQVQGLSLRSRSGVLVC